jgi:hypothetical protein
LDELYRGASSPSKTLPSDFLPVAFKELGVVSEELQVALEELQRRMKNCNSASVLAAQAYAIRTI